MSRPAPSFPAFDEWQKMSEREQDALLDRLETAGRGGLRMKRVLVALVCAGVGAAVGVALLALRP